MTWSEAKEEFQKVLDLQRSNANHTKALTRKYRMFGKAGESLRNESDLTLKRIIKGEQLLTGLEELKDYCPDISEEFLIEFLKTATLALQNPQDQQYYKSLSDALRRLNSSINTDDFKEDVVPERLDLYEWEKELALVIGCAAFILLIPVAVSGLWITTSAAAIVLVAALIGAGISAYKTHKTNQVVDGKQLKDLSDFVEEFAPEKTDAEEKEFPGGFAPQNI